MKVLPDVVVGVDFGMTSTGVAYSVGPEWTRPETLQNWPGNPRGGIADKVDTKIAYDGMGGIVDWGFMVDTSRSDDHYRYEELFKLYLDPDFKDHYDGAPSLAEARGWFTDFLSCIYRAVDRHLQETIPEYNMKNVEFRFSVPTTWKNPAMIAEMEQLIRNSGFGKKNSRHTAHIALTEAEAAAVYASKQQYAVGDVFLVCDAGGGTSDVSILKVTSSGIGQTELEPLSWVEGRAVGSTLIDFRVEKLIAERLTSIRHLLASDPATIAHRMLRESSRFESFKCNLGDAAMDLPTLRIPVPELEYGKDYGCAHIEGSHMIIQKEELQGVFDDQIEKIMTLIDEQLATLQNMNPREEITYLVLSGGLGSSPYLQKALRARYELGASCFANAKDMQILKVPKPQLAVSHGIVLDRVQQIKENRIVYKQRYCRCSYGVVVRQEYDPKLHLGEHLTTDPRDKKVWAEKQIDWFIIQGQKVSVQDGINKHYSMKIQPGREHLPWSAEIVMSTLPIDQLPTSINKAGAQRVCKVESGLPHDMKLKNRHWYSPGQQYLRAEFDMQVLIGAADLKFQTLSRGGVISKDHKSIDVQWASSAERDNHRVVAELEGNRVREFRILDQRFCLDPILGVLYNFTQSGGAINISGRGISLSEPVFWAKRMVWDDIKMPSDLAASWDQHASTGLIFQWSSVVNREDSENAGHFFNDLDTIDGSWISTLALWYNKYVLTGLKMDYTNGRSISQGRCEGGHGEEDFGHLDRGGRRIGLIDAEIKVPLLSLSGFQMDAHLARGQAPIYFGISIIKANWQYIHHFNFPVPASGWTIQGSWGQEADGAFHRLGVVWSKND